MLSLTAFDPFPSKKVRASWAEDGKTADRVRIEHVHTRYKYDTVLAYIHLHWRPSVTASTVGILCSVIPSALTLAYNTGSPN